MGAVFPLNVPGRTGYGTIRDWLKNRARSIQAAVSRYALDEFAGAGLDVAIESVTSAHVVDRFVLDEPSVDPDPKSTHSYACDDPTCVEVRRPGGSRHHRHHDKMFHISVPVRSGDTSLLKYAPPCSYRPLDEDYVSCSRDEITIKFARGQEAHAQELFSALTQSLEHVNQAIDDYNNELPAKVASAFERHRKGLDADAKSVRLAGFPVRRSDERQVEYRIPDKKRESSRPVPRPSDVGETGYQLSRADFDEVLHCIGSWADSAERHPGVATGRSENGLRDSMLAVLRGRFVDGTGEAFSVAGKTDLRVLVRTASGAAGPQIFHAECKIWGGPASVDEAFEQLVEKYSTHRDRFGALVFFIVERASPERVPETAVQRLITNFGGVEVTPVAGWRVVQLPDPQEPARLITLAIVCVDVQRFAVA